MEKGHGGGRGMGGRRGGKRRKERGVAPWVQEGIDAPGARYSSFVKQTRSVYSLFTLRLLHVQARRQKLAATVNRKRLISCNDGRDRLVCNDGRGCIACNRFNSH